MAAEQIIAIGTGAANSADIVLTDGNAVVFLNDSGGPDTQGGLAEILIKDASNRYFKIGELRSGEATMAQVIAGPGTYRITRPASSGACGVVRA